MVKEGRYLTCDVCGKEVFQSAVAINYDHYSKRTNTYNDAGWKFNSDLGDLCPRCNRAVTDLLRMIKEKGVIPSGETEKG